MAKRIIGRRGCRKGKSLLAFARLLGDIRRPAPIRNRSYASGHVKGAGSIYQSGSTGVSPAAQKVSSGVGDASSEHSIDRMARPPLATHKSIGGRGLSCL